MREIGQDASLLPASPHAPIPRSFLACLPYVWSCVLFPGRAPRAQPLRVTKLILLLIVPAALLYPCLSFLLFEPDEGRYAEIPREMLARGEWVVPYLQGEPYLDKPPLFYWLVIGSYRLFGVHDWSAHMVPALAVHGCVLLTYLLGRRRLGEGAAFWGALILALAPGFTSVGRLLVLDGVLTFWVTLSLFAALEATDRERVQRKWWATSAIACALGILTKGPVALLLLAPPFFLFRWLSKRSCRVGLREIGTFVAILLALCLPWYAAICVRLPQFAGHFLWRHNVLRFLDPFDHQEPVWFYVPVLLGALLPASLLAPGWLRFLVSEDPAIADKRCPALGFFILTGAWCVLFFSLSGSKLVTYVLPALPPFALGLGHYVAARPWRRGLWFKAIPAFAVVLLAVLHYVALPWYARFRSPMSQSETMAEYCGDSRTPVVCYPRNCDSVAFYLGRDDFRSYRGKQVGEMLNFLQEQPRTVILFTHRHSPAGLAYFLPSRGLELRDLKPVSHSWVSSIGTEDCLMGVVEHVTQADNRSLHGVRHGGDPHLGIRDLRSGVSAGSETRADRDSVVARSDARAERGRGTLLAPKREKTLLPGNRSFRLGWFFES